MRSQHIKTYKKNKEAYEKRKKERGITDNDIDFESINKAFKQRKKEEKKQWRHVNRTIKNIRKEKLPQKPNLFNKPLTSNQCLLIFFLGVGVLLMVGMLDMAIREEKERQQSRSVPFVPLPDCDHPGGEPTYYSCPPKEDTPRDKRFSVIDGSVPEFTKEIKARMHNPDSFRHVDTVYKQCPHVQGDIIVRTTFRGENAFGATVQHTAQAYVDRRGRVYDIKFLD